MSARANRRLGLDRFQLLEDSFDYVFLPREQRIRPTRVQAAERSLVERRRLHDAARGQLFDYHLDEADLLRRQALVREKADRKFKGPFWVR